VERQRPRPLKNNNKKTAERFFNRHAASTEYLLFREKLLDAESLQVLNYVSLVDRLRRRFRFCMIEMLSSVCAAGGYPQAGV